MRNFVLLYNPHLFPEILRIMEKCGVEEWLSLWKGALLFNGQYDATHYMDLIHEQNRTALFFITEYDGQDVHGWIPENIWSFIGTGKDSTAQELVKTTNV